MGSRIVAALSGIVADADADADDAAERGQMLGAAADSVDNAFPAEVQARDSDCRAGTRGNAQVDWLVAGTVAAPALTADQGGEDGDEAMRFGCGFGEPSGFVVGLVVGVARYH
ncbi:MAG: hypothetical protein KIH64_003555 [Mycobacterium sp.]|nr:hypothetical protein [Mycobacterium sp.]